MPAGHRSPTVLLVAVSLLITIALPCAAQTAMPPSGMDAVSADPSAMGTPPAAAAPTGGVGGLYAPSRPGAVLTAQRPAAGIGLGRENGIFEPPLSVPPGSASMGSLVTASPPGSIFAPSPASFADQRPVGLPEGSSAWYWQLLPSGLLYKSYLAGDREPRLASNWFYEKTHGWYWDATLGARVGLVRYGSNNSLWPEGWQLDMEGATFVRMDLESGRDLVAADFRAGMPLTWRRGPWEFKFGYYHLSSHLGDEFMLSHPNHQRINYVRETLVAGLGLRPHPDWRVYVETGYAVWIAGGALPWEFQFGVEYAPAEATTIRGAPFIAANGHLRQENKFGGNATVEAGWMWRGCSGHVFRVGLRYFNGMSDQYQFFRKWEEQVGVSIWYDF